MITGVGTTQQQLTVPMFKNYEVDIPNTDDLSKFTRITGPLFEAIEANKKENESMSRLRDALLPKLMSGEIDLSKIELPTPSNNHLPAD